MSNILISSEIESKLVDELSNARLEVNIITAFCKLSTLKKIDSVISSSVKKRLLVRFLPSDISSGATDKEIFDYCNENNWTIFYDFSLHAKTFIFDHLKCIIGSSNLTNRGLGIADKSNKEAASYIQLSNEDYNKVLTLYSDANRLELEIYNLIINSADDIQVKQSSSVKIKSCINVLMPEDFPNVGTDLVELYSLKSYKWLYNYLNNKEEKCAYFGELTANIHEIFIKDPRPFRKDIKQHLVDLFDCIKRLNPKHFEIERPNYSEVIKLV